MKVISHMDSLQINFAYEKKIGHRFVLNGLSEGMPLYERWINKTHEYASQDCGNPLKSILLEGRLQIRDFTVKECVESNRTFFYPIEILGSNPSWLSPESYYDHTYYSF